MVLVPAFWAVRSIANYCRRDDEARFRSRLVGGIRTLISANRGGNKQSMVESVLTGKS